MIRCRQDSTPRGPDDRGAAADVTPRGIGTRTDVPPVLSHFMPEEMLEERRRGGPSRREALARYSVEILGALNRRSRAPAEMGGAAGPGVHPASRDPAGEPARGRREPSLPPSDGPSATNKMAPAGNCARTSYDIAGAGRDIRAETRGLTRGGSPRPVRPLGRVPMWAAKTERSRRRAATRPQRRGRLSHGWPSTRAATASEDGTRGTLNHTGGVAAGEPVDRAVTRNGRSEPPTCRPPPELPPKPPEKRGYYQSTTQLTSTWCAEGNIPERERAGVSRRCGLRHGSGGRLPRLATGQQAGDDSWAGATRIK